MRRRTGTGRRDVVVVTKRKCIWKGEYKYFPLQKKSVIVSLCGWGNKRERDNATQVCLCIFVYICVYLCVFVCLQHKFKFKFLGCFSHMIVYRHGHVRGALWL